MILSKLCFDEVDKVVWFLSDKIITFIVKKYYKKNWKFGLKILWKFGLFVFFEMTLREEFNKIEIWWSWKSDLTIHCFLINPVSNLHKLKTLFQDEWTRQLLKKLDIRWILRKNLHLYQHCFDNWHCLKSVFLFLTEYQLTINNNNNNNNNHNKSIQERDIC